MNYFLKKNNRAQVTIFIIIGIIIVAAAFLIYSFYPQIKTSLNVQQQTPQTFIQTCIEKEIIDTVNKISLQGGSLTPENFIRYNNSNVNYLCYTNEYYRNCLIQQPLLKEHIESEIKNAISADAGKCFSSMKSSYEKQGYTADLIGKDIQIELLPNRVISTFNYSLTLTKGESTQKYNSFVVMLNNNLYELVAIAGSILNWEATYGDANPRVYMTYYHDLRVDKVLMNSGEKVYILTDRIIGNKFQFASRSQVWPAGYVISV